MVELALIEPQQKEDIKITVDQVIDLWNKLSPGYHKKVYLRSPYYDKKFRVKFEQARNDLPDLSSWEMLILETLKLFEEEFWAARRGKQGFNWLFQRRSRGEGEINYIYYYELAMTAKESDGDKESLHNKYFGENV